MEPMNPFPLMILFTLLLSLAMTSFLSMDTILTGQIYYMNYSSLLISL